MTTRFTPINGDDIAPLYRVTVRDDQNRFIAPNEITIAQARFKTGAYDFCIWDGDTRVGLLAVIDFSEHDDLDDSESPDAMYVWRLLIGEEFQRKGHGRAAMVFAEDFGRKRGRKRMQIQAVTDNHVAISFYERLGYARTGVVVDGELQLEKPL